MKMTTKFSTALSVARRETISANGSQEELSSRLQEEGYFWDSTRKEWNYSALEDADEPTAFVLVRVWADEEIVQEVADDVTKGLKKLYNPVERSEVYRCCPPKQREARIYLRFMPKRKGAR